MDLNTVIPAYVFIGACWMFFAFYQQIRLNRSRKWYNLIIVCLMNLTLWPFCMILAIRLEIKARRKKANVAS